MGAGNHSWTVHRQFPAPSLGGPADAQDMSPAAIIALIRDAVILGAVLAILWFVHRADTDHVKVTDLKAIQSQLADNAIRAKQYAQEAADAQAQHSHDVETISAAVAAHSAQPVFVRIPASPSPLHGLPATANDQSTASRSSNPGSRDAVPPIDIRPGIIAFEQRYENALGECRQALASWPH